MDQELQQAWEQLQDAVSVHHGFSALAVGLAMLLAGVLGLYVRALYRRCGVSASDSEAITRVFPLLAIVTAGVIGIVKTSLPLSLGLVGALSVVRFRSAIKEPEELAYLFLSVAVGLAIGAGAPLVALAMVAVATVLALLLRVVGRRGRRHSLMLTITGDAQGDFDDGGAGIFAAVGDLAGPFTLQRLDIENGRGQARFVLRPADTRRTAELIAQLRRRLPECEFSYVNLSSSL